jgi:hypothetical protein
VRPRGRPAQAPWTHHWGRPPSTGCQCRHQSPTCTSSACCEPAQV